MTTGDTALKEVSYFTYLDSWVTLIEQDLNSMTNVWKLNLPRNTKLHFFNATVKAILLNGCERPEALSASVDGFRMLLAALNINQNEHFPNKHLYGERQRPPGRPTITYVDILRTDVGVETTGELSRCMEDSREVYLPFVHTNRVRVHRNFLWKALRVSS